MGRVGSLTAQPEHVTPCSLTSPILIRIGAEPASARVRAKSQRDGRNRPSGPVPQGLVRAKVGHPFLVVKRGLRFTRPPTGDWP